MLKQKTKIAYQDTKVRIPMDLYVEVEDLKFSRRVKSINAFAEVAFRLGVRHYKNKKPMEK